MIKQKDFEDFWKDIKEELSNLQLIKNWTAKSGFIGEDFTAIYILKPRTIEGGYIEAIGPSMKYSRKVKKHSFQKIYPYWNGYIKGRIQYQFLSHKKINKNATLHAKYIISILHQYEHLMEK